MCIRDRAERRPGGKRPGMRQIEREGYAWSRLGIDSQEAVDAYLRKYAQRQGAFPGYMRALNLPERLPAPSEEKYLEMCIRDSVKGDGEELVVEKHEEGQDGHAEARAEGHVLFRQGEDGAEHVVVHVGGQAGG